MRKITTIAVGLLILLYSRLVKVMDQSIDTPSLLSVRHLGKQFTLPNGEVLKAVDDISFKIMPGEILGIVGESGSGKSTLGRCLVGLEDKTSGEVYFRDTPLPMHYRGEDFRRYAGLVQMVFQDPYSALNPRLTVGDSLAEPLILLGRSVKDAKKEVAYWLARVGLHNSMANRYPQSFSGGQRQRLSIARALIAQPALLICDEAVSALDVSVQAQIINLLAELRQEKYVAMMFISHDLAVVQHLADRVAVMQRGKIVEIGAAHTVLGHPQHAYTQALKAACPHVVVR
jgi:ABC-type oligopeptide transport system ATPase subunit